MFGFKKRRQEKLRKLCEEDTELIMKSLHLEGDEIKIVVDDVLGNLRKMAYSFGDLLETVDNYLIISLVDRKRLQTIEVTLRKEGGLSPAEKTTEMRKLLKDMVSHYEDHWDDGYHTRMRDLCQSAKDHFSPWEKE